MARMQTELAWFGRRLFRVESRTMTPLLLMIPLVLPRTPLAQTTRLPWDPLRQLLPSRKVLAF